MDIAHDADSCESEDDSVDDIPEIEMITQFATALPLHTDSHIRVAWCNIAGCDDIQKIERVMALMRAQRLDILCLTDTRIISPVWGNAIRSAAMQRLGAGSTVDIHVTSKSGPKDFVHVGGQIIIKGPRINVPTSPFCDPSGCAAIAGIDLRVGNVDIRIISTYFPGSTGSPNPDSAGLWDKLQKHLHCQSQHITPIEYIQSYITEKIQQQIGVSGSICLIGGDFNATRNANSAGTGVHPPIDSWG